MPPASAHPSTTAVVLVAAATDDGRPAALLAWEQTSILRRLLDQLASLAVRDVHVLARERFADAVGAELADATGPPVAVHATADVAHDLREIAAIAGRDAGTLVVVNGDVITHREALAGLLADPRVATGVLSTGGRAGRPYTFRIRSRRGRVVGAGSAFHYCRHSTGGYLGVLKVAGEARPVVAAQCERLAVLADGHPPSWDEELELKEVRWRHALARTQLRARWREAAEAAQVAGESPPAPPSEEAANDPVLLEAVALDPERREELRRRLGAAREDASALVLVGLVRAGAAVGNSYLRELFWARPLSAADVAVARERIGDYDEDKVLLDSAVKATDGFFTSFFVSPYSRYIARWAARRGLTPNQVTSFSLALGVLTAAAFATGERWGLIAGAVILQAAFTFDCVDGQLARYTRQFSKLGAWLDSIFDRTKEYVVFAGLAIGATRTGDSAWLLAGCALTLQTVRHMFDFSWAAAAHQTIAATPPPPLDQAWDSLNKPLSPLEPRALGADTAPAGAGAGVVMAGAAVAVAPAAPPRPPALRGVAVVALRGWRRIDRLRAIPWIKRIVAFPIGERFAAISITAALWSAHTTFVVLLAWGGVAAAYGLAGRILRSAAR
jgi:phosphatidylglycerophosphate synthase